MYHKLAALMTRPSLHQSSDCPFWDDDHISAQMLKAHLDPDRDAVSRTFSFMDQSAAWIAHIAPPETFPRLLDLGCGPGLYAQRFARLGYRVTGVDLSRAGCVRRCSRRSLFRRRGYAGDGAGEERLITYKEKEKPSRMQKYIQRNQHPLSKEPSYAFLQT